MTRFKSVSWRDALAIVLLILFPFVYFYPVTLGQAVWFTRDLSRIYHPFAIELAGALDAGRWPLWTPSLQAGFPLLAEGQIAAFYPPQHLLVGIFPPHIAVSYEMLLHLAFAALGMYFCARTFGVGVNGAWIAGFIFSFNGFMIQKLYHAPILLTAAWLPWLILLHERFQRARKNHEPRAGRWFLLTCLALAMQWLAGSAQIALLNSITIAVFGLFGGLFWNRYEENTKSFGTRARAILWTALVLGLGAGLAAIQLAPTAELTGYSTRAGGLNEKLLTLYSYSNESLAQFIFPFFLGEPSDDNVEMWGYVGLSTLFLAVSALWCRRDAKTVFLISFALVSLSLTLGAANPLFQLLARLPIFNLFRVPARYVFPFAFAMALLAAIGVEEISNRFRQAQSDPAAIHKSRVNLFQRLDIWIGFLFVLLLAGVIRLAHTPSLEFWLAAWRVLPGVLGISVFSVLALGWTRRIGRDVLVVLMLGLTTLDLSSYAATFLSTTVAQLTPSAIVTQIPRGVTALPVALQPVRVYTDETVWPSLVSQRNSLYPNFGLVYGIEMAHAYTPLMFELNENYFHNLSPAMLNLLNARYFSIPLEPRQRDRTPMPYAHLALDVVDNEVVIPPTTAISVQVDSFVEDTLKLATSSLAAELILKFEDGTAKNFPLRVGIETADWDLGKGNALPSMRVAHQTPAFLRAAGRTFDGFVYRAQFDLAALAPKIVSINLRAVIPRAQISIERIAFVDEKGNAVSLAALTNRNEFRLAYMSDTVAIWENLDVMPRAFIAHRAEVVSDDAAIQRLQEPGFRADRRVLLASGPPLDVPDGNAAADRAEITRYEPERVIVSVTTDRPGYLVLLDSWYPGWNATVDGIAAPIYRADYLFRAVPIPAGTHQVIFEFRPMIFVFGGMVSGVSAIVTMAIALWLRRAE